MSLNDTRLTEEKSGWISVKDRMPEVAGRLVLVSAINKSYDLNEIFIAFLGYEVLKWWTSDIIYTQDRHNNQVRESLEITHWMPLPEAPERDGK